MLKSKFRRVWNGLGRLNQNRTIWVDLELRTMDRTTAALYRTHLYLNEKKHGACATSSPCFPSSSSCAFTEETDYLVLVMDDLQKMTGFTPEVAFTHFWILFIDCFVVFHYFTWPTV